MELAKNMILLEIERINELIKKNDNKNDNKNENLKFMGIKTKRPKTAKRQKAKKAYK